jgi:hypothetical protein
VQESNLACMTVSYINRKYGISSGLLFHWRNRMVEGSKKAVTLDDEVIGRCCMQSINILLNFIKEGEFQYEVQL